MMACGSDGNRFLRLVGFVEEAGLLLSILCKKSVWITSCLDKIILLV